MDEQRGLYEKYIVTKANGEPVDPGAQYFVLRLDTDMAARSAALEYAAWMQDEAYKGNPELGKQLEELVDRLGGVELMP